MKTRVLFVLAGVLLLSLACSFSIGVGSTPTPIPPTATPIPSPTPLPPPPTPLPPTALPSTSESTSSSAPFLLTANTYEHPQGLFSLKIPQRWSMVDEMDYGASFAPDDEIGFLQVTATNTIYPLQGDALLQFAKSIEQAFETYDGYQLLSQKSGNQVVLMERVVTYQGVPQRVRTYFMAWYYSYDQGNNAVLERFDEPNGLAFIESLAYDDGTPISKSLAGSFALQLLHDYYANDIKVTDDQAQPDGSERLIWYSKSLNTKGITFFEARGTTFLLLTLVADRDAFNAFSPVFSAVIQSYNVP